MGNDGYICPKNLCMDVPKVCPECGHATRRTGNRHHREVCCANPAMRDVQIRPDYGYQVLACGWRTTVFHLPDGKTIADLNRAAGWEEAATA